MWLQKAIKEMFKDRSLYAKRKCWTETTICLKRVGWMCQYGDSESEEEKIQLDNDPEENFIQFIKDNRYINGKLDLKDIIAFDWIVFKEESTEKKNKGALK